MIEKAVQTGLEISFAAPTKAGTFGRALTDAYKAIPMLTTVNPFPRFWANSMDFLMSYNPVGALRLLGKDAEGKFVAANPEARAKIPSQAAIGTGFLATALALRSGAVPGVEPGAKWYQLKVNGENVDTRAYAPFSTYLFMGDVLKTMSEVGVDTIKDGRTLKQAMIERNNYTTADIIQGVVSINRIAGTGAVLVDVAREGTMDKKLDLIRDFFAQYLGSFTVPFATLKDFVAAVDPDEGKQRDTRGTLLGPAMRNVPSVSQTLPEKPSPLRADIPTTEHPVLRQLTGVSTATALVVDDEVNRIGMEFKAILPGTGVPEVDRELARRMGPMVERQLPALIEHPAYQQLSNVQKRLVMTGAFQVLRNTATKQFTEERPDLSGKLKMHRIPKTVEDLLTEAGMRVKE